VCVVVDKTAGAPPIMQALAKTIELVLDVKCRGGRLLPRDADTMLLTDYDHASMASLSLMVEQFPETQITTCQSTNSSSGYIIVFTHMYSRPVFTSSSFVQGVLVCLLLTGMISHSGVAYLIR